MQRFLPLLTAALSTALLLGSCASSLDGSLRASVPEVDPAQQSRLSARVHMTTADGPSPAGP